MAASQSLFRRHRNRGDVDENDNVGGGGSGGGMDIENSNQDSTTLDVSLSSSNNVVEGISSSPNDDPVIGISNDTSNIHDNNDDEEEELIVQVPQNSNNNNNILGGGAQFVIPPVWEPSEEATAQRRRALHQEVERIQRANFLHFMVLCLVPTTLLIIVIATKQILHQVFWLQIMMQKDLYIIIISSMCFPKTGLMVIQISTNYQKFLVRIVFL